MVFSTAGTARGVSALRSLITRALSFLLLAPEESATGNPLEKTCGTERTRVWDRLRATEDRASGCGGGGGSGGGCESRIRFGRRSVGLTGGHVRRRRTAARSPLASRWPGSTGFTTHCGGGEGDCDGGTDGAVRCVPPPSPLVSSLLHARTLSCSSLPYPGCATSLSSCLSGLTPPARIRKGGRGKKPHYGSSRVYRCNSGARCRNCEIKRRDGIHRGRKNGPNANALLVILFEKSAPQCGAGPRAKDSARTNRNTCVEAARNR